MNTEKYRAIRDYFPHGWKAQVKVNYPSKENPSFVDINESPLFSTPTAAIIWAASVWDGMN